MITHFPLYYKDFKCIASRCKESCCSAGWQIFIDQKTADFYKSVPGDFGQKLRDSITFSNPPEFILTKNGRCPFLNNNNLCDIYSKLGPERLCQICTEHPRFYECFNSFVECGLGIYCEEACRIILTQEVPFRIYSKETDDTISSDCNEELLNYLYKCRLQIFEYLSNADIPANSCICDILWFTHTVQQNIDSNMLDDEIIFSVSPTCHTDIKNFFNVLLTLEPNDKNWFQTIEKNTKIYDKNIDKLKDFYKQNPQVQQYIKNLANYYVYRYYLRSIYDEDVLSSLKFIAVSLAIIQALFFCKWIENKKIDLDECVMIAKKYAEEIECSDDNINHLLSLCYEDEIFSTENILGLYK